MKLKRTTFSLAICALAAIAIISPASAAQKHHTKHGHGARHKITADQARVVVLKKYPGKVVGKIALENEDGKMQYAVNVRSGKKLREVMVDANSGKIASVEVTTKAEEAKEAAAEARAEHKKSGKGHN